MNVPNIGSDSRNLRRTYALDLYMAFGLRAIILLSTVVLVATFLGGCSPRSPSGPGRIVAVELPPIFERLDSESKTWNNPPHGGDYEKSNRSPCGPVEINPPA